MEWFSAPDYGLARLVLQRGIGGLYVIAFVVVLNQFRPLLGERGLLPVSRYSSIVTFWESPSLFHWRYTDGLLLVVAWTGTILSAAVVAGVLDLVPLWASVAVWLVLWALYLSIVNVGRAFYAFGWELLLLEAGFLAAFLGNREAAPPILTLLLLRWLLFRVEFGAGMIKLRGDTCWRDLTCLYYHHQTQPLPNPLSWWFHRLPRPLHRIEVAANHVVQLVVPFLLFAPQPVAGTAAVAVIVTQAWLVLSGNFAWLNAVTIVLAFAALQDGLLERLLPVAPPDASTTMPAWFAVLVVAVTLLLVVLSWWPVRNLVSREQRMNRSFNPFHLASTYGAFGSVTRVRDEIVIEGTEDGETWHAYEFKAKPGDPTRRPPQVAPYHLRLDWLMWFAAMSMPERHPWFLVLVERLLEADRPALKLLRRDPFDGRRPAAVRALRYRYRFTTREERRETGAWWARDLVGDYLPAVRLEGGRATAWSSGRR